MVERGRIGAGHEFTSMVAQLLSLASGLATAADRIDKSR